MKQRLLKGFAVYYVVMVMFFIIANIRYNVRSGLDPVLKEDRWTLLGLAFIVPLVPVWPNWRAILK